MIGIELRGNDAPGVLAAEEALTRGVIALPAGPLGTVLELTPPSVLTVEQLEAAVRVIVDSLDSPVDEGEGRSL